MLRGPASNLDAALQVLFGENQTLPSRDAVMQPVPGTPPASEGQEEDVDMEDVHDPNPGEGDDPEGGNQESEGGEEEWPEEDPVVELHPWVPFSPSQDLSGLRRRNQPPYAWPDTTVFCVNTINVSVPIPVLSLLSEGDDPESWDAGAWVKFLDLQEHKLRDLRDQFKKVYNWSQGMSEEESLAWRQESLFGRTVFLVDM
jgi:hypothetical protein